MRQWQSNGYRIHISSISVESLEFQWEVPRDPYLRLVDFRNRIGGDGMEKIWKVWIKIQPARDKKRAMKLWPWTPQPKRSKTSTYPTDAEVEEEDHRAMSENWKERRC